MMTDVGELLVGGWFSTGLTAGVVSADVTKKETYIMPLACVDRCYYGIYEIKLICKPVDHHGLRAYFCILLPMGNILLEKTIDVLYSNKCLLY